MSAVGEFMMAYFHYTINQRLFEDTCRQLRDYKGEYEGKKQLVKETLRLARAVSDLADTVENAIPPAVEQIRKHGSSDPFLANAIPLISNNVKEDRARASAYTMFVASKKYGGSVACARKPMVANPFVFDESDDSDLYPDMKDDDSPEPWEDTFGTGGEGSDAESERSEEDSDHSDDGRNDGEDPEEESDGSEDTYEGSDDGDSGWNEADIPQGEDMDPDQYEGLNDLGYSEDGEAQE